MNWSDKVVLITGGTGSFGRKFLEIMLREYHPKKLIVFSRDELKQQEMRVSGFDQENLRYFIGDVRDPERLEIALKDVDVVVHAAALKQVTACEYNPIEAIMTNVNGARNLISAALRSDVEKVIALSTDKAVNPINLYGATKLCAEKLFVQSNAYSGETGARFSCARYGNVIGSRGSVISLFQEQLRNGSLKVTDPSMTRFWLTLEQAVRFIILCVEKMHGGEVFIPKIPSMSIMDLVKVISPRSKVEYIGVRPGEKLHEVLIAKDEARQTYEVDGMYIILPAHPWWPQDAWKDGTPLPEGFCLASNTNDYWLTTEEGRRLIEGL